jgi:hypothetical protein
LRLVAYLAGGDGSDGYEEGFDVWQPLRLAGWESWPFVGRPATLALWSRQDVEYTDC